MEEKRRNLTPNPFTKANCFSRLLFWWTNQVFHTAYQRHLDDLDIYEVLPEDSSVQLSNGLGREWEKEVYRHRTGGQPSLFNAVFRGYGGWVVGTGLLFFLEEAVRVGQIILLSELISYFEPKSNVSQQDAYLLALGWSLSHLLVLVLDNLAFHRSFYMGLKMRVACTSLIYRKLIRLNQTSLQELNTNGIITLFAQDAQKFDQSCLGVNYIWIAPLQSVAIIYILWARVGMGPYSLIGVVVVVLLTPIQFSLGKYLTKLREVMSSLTDRRIRVMHEIFTGMWTIKTNNWEKPFSTLVNAVRRSEWVYLRALSYSRGFNSAMYLCAGKLVMFAAFGTFIFTDHVIRPNLVFIALALYEILRTSLCLLMPWGVQHLQEVLAAIQRLQRFLLMEERSVLEAPSQLNILNVGRPSLPPEVALQFDDYTASWSKDAKAVSLEVINFSVRKGDMWAICGPRGSGKSSLFMGVLGEIPRLGGFIRTNGKVAYVPQRPWVFQGTLRDNILFGKDMDRRKYNKALSSCVLLQDLDFLPQGDLSIIGEKGVNLTEGQKAKICLARAVYQDADNYLIDDILNTMDETTSVQVFTKCFCGVLNNKTILYVTSDLNFIRAADHIIFMRMGQIACQGMFDDIRNVGINIRRELAEFGHNEESDRRLPTATLETNESLEKEGMRKEGLNMTLRQKLGMESCSSEESLDSILLEFTRDAKEVEKFMEDEKEGTRVSIGLYWRYLSAGAGVFGVVVLLFISVVLQVAFVLCDWWLYNWMTKENSLVTEQALSQPMSSLQPNVSSAQTTAGVTILYTIAPSIANDSRRLTFYVYLAIFVAFILLTFLRASLFSWVAIRAAKTLHKKMFTSIMRAPMAFFEKNSVGRILTRFVHDISCIDDPLPATLSDCIQFFGLVAGNLVLIGVANVWLLIVIVPVVAMVTWLRHYYLYTAKEVKRLELSGRKPIFQHLSTTVEGLWSIRAFQNEDKFVQMFDVHQDHQTAASYMSLAINRWFSLRLDLFSIMLLILQVFISVLAKQYVDDGLLCLALAYTINLMGLFQYAFRQSAELETQLSSVERTRNYAAVKPEGQWITSVRPAQTWPRYGIITFEGTTMINQERATKLLRNMWCCIRAQEKVGIMGDREESKTAMVSAILRLSESSGIIRIDGLDIRELGLQDLREKMTVVAQDPVMFGGSIRRNLDPMTRFPDAHLWKALAEIRLRDKVEQLPGKLYAELGEVGAAFTLGERQLLGLARAMLNTSKIIIFQESPSIIDKRTENHLLHLLKTKFSQCTVIIIAQRLSTIIDMDRIMVLNEGRVKEFDSAHILLQNKNGFIYNLFEKLSSNEQSRLRKLAQEKYEEKPYQPPPQSLGGIVPPTVNLANTYTARNFLPSFQTSRISGVLSHFTGNRFSTNRF